MHNEEQSVQSEEYRKSLISLHIAVMLFGLSAVLGQFVTAPAVIVAGGRVICSSLLLFLLSIAGRASLKLKSRKDYGIAVFAGIVLAAHWTTFFQAIQSSSVAIGTITFSTFPLFLTFLEPLLFREKLKVTSVLSAAVLLLGVFITIPEFSLENQITIGILWGMVSSLSYAVLSLANRYLSRSYAARTVCLYEQGTAAVVLLPAIFFVKTNWTTQNILGIAAIGFICTAFAHSLYVAAQRKVKAQTAGIVSGMETVYGIVYALLFLGEVPGIRELIGGAVILGVALVISLRKE
ncbi:DMT family transporter [Drancourtella massiliensis]|uniref:DMT family transporter n=1 Tax=Drancourtella massiliensis TaxID=1632013 RepID=A0ABS2EFW5_9FIRM|nr:DMT family transporter [Drancourtella massiliensis]MBM6743904.1 DMT family transporter [Drancourtella massiliensis]